MKTNSTMVKYNYHRKAFKMGEEKEEIESNKKINKKIG